MNIKEFYESMPLEDKLTFRTKVLKGCEKELPTFYRWVAMLSRPGLKDQKTISRISGISIELLFPRKTSPQAIEQ